MNLEKDPKTALLSIVRQMSGVKKPDDLLKRLDQAIGALPDASLALHYELIVEALDELAKLVNLTVWVKPSVEITPRAAGRSKTTTRRGHFRQLKWADKLLTEYKKNLAIRVVRYRMASKAKEPPHAQTN